MDFINFILNCSVLFLIIVVFYRWFKKFPLSELGPSSFFLIISFFLLFLSRTLMTTNTVVSFFRFSYPNPSIQISSYFLWTYTFLVPLSILFHLLFLFKVKSRWIKYYIFSGLTFMSGASLRQLLLPELEPIFQLDSPIAVIGVFYAFSLIFIVINKLFVYKGVDELMFGWVIIVCMNLGIIVITVTNRILNNQSGGLLSSEKIGRFSIVDGPFALALSNILAIGALLYLYRFYNRILSGDIGYRSLSKVLEVKNINAFKSYSTHNLWVKPIIASDQVSVEALHIQENIQRVIDCEINFISDSQLSLNLYDSIYQLSQITKVRVVDLEYLFQNHCKYSFSKYSKFIKVCKADYLIQNGFLLNSTVDQLAKEVGFDNRVTLFNNFKTFLESTIRDRKPSKNVS